MPDFAVRSSLIWRRKMLKLKKTGHRDLEKYYTLMQMDFDSEELISKFDIHRALMNGSMELLTAYDDESNLDLAYVLTCPKGAYGYVLIKYFAVLPWYREKGIGKETMRLINRYYADSQGLLAEITEFEDDYPDHVRKLIKFFMRFGYNEIPVEYTIGGTKAHLFAKGIKGTGDIAPVAHRIIQDEYSRLLSAAAANRMIDINKYRE